MINSYIISTGGHDDVEHIFEKMQAEQDATVAHEAKKIAERSASDNFVRVYKINFSTGTLDKVYGSYGYKEC